MSNEKISPFYALVFRQKHIQRWGLMRNIFPETLAQHSSECAMIAHALAVIGNKIYGKSYDTGKIVTMALFHDVPEVFTGDMPTPVKYANPVIRKEFAVIEEQSTQNLLSKLPCEIRDDFTAIFESIEADGEYHKLLKAADRLCAYIKCLEEEKYSNSEFSSARLGIEKKLDETKKELPELEYFMEKFLPAFDLTLDQQQEI